MGWIEQICRLQYNRKCKTSLLAAGKLRSVPGTRLGTPSRCGDNHYCFGITWVCAPTSTRPLRAMAEASCNPEPTKLLFGSDRVAITWPGSSTRSYTERLYRGFRGFAMTARSVDLQRQPEHRAMAGFQVCSIPGIDEKIVDISWNPSLAEDPCLAGLASDSIVNGIRTVEGWMYQKDKHPILGRSFGQIFVVKKRPEL